MSVHLFSALQEVRKGEAHCAAFRGFVAEHVRKMRAAGPPPADDVSVAAHLLRATVRERVFLERCSTGLERFVFKKIAGCRAGLSWADLAVP